MVVPPAKLTQGVEDVDVEPTVEIREARAPCAGVEQDGERTLHVARRLGDQRQPRAEMLSQQGSPIWQARANDCSRLSEAPASSPWQSRTWPSNACGHGRKDSQW